MAAPVAATAAAGVNPLYAALLKGGFGLLEGIGGWMGGGTERDLQKQALLTQQWKLSKAKEVYAQLQQMIKSGTTMGGGKKMQMMAGHRRRLAPALGKIRAGAMQAGAGSSPEIWRMINNQYMPLEAGYSAKLDEMDLGNMQGIRQALMRMVYQ